MNDIKVIIDGVIIKDDYSTDPNYLIKCEIDTELEDIIPSVELEVKKTIENIVTLSQSQIVEIYTGSTPRLVFYGPIMEIKRDGPTAKIHANMETIALLRIKINKIYTSTEAHEGKNELIVKDMIERAGLTASVQTPIEPNIIDEFKCIHAVTWERIVSLMKAIDYQIRYDPVTRIVHYEPRGFTNNGVTLTVQTEILGLPEWREVTDGMINDLRIDGATTETQITETGTIGTTSGWETTGIQLTKTPNIVELIVDGVQLTGGTKDASVNHDYWVDRENKKIMPKTGTTFTTDLAIVNYSWSAPAPVQDFRQDSIDSYGLFEEVLNLTDVSSVADAESRIEKLLDARSEPFTTGTLKVKENTLDVGEIVTVVDTISQPNINQQFVVSQIKRVYPGGYDEIKVGDKEWKLEDDIVEMESRIKRLEENFIRNQDLLLQLLRLEDNSAENTALWRERYTKVLKSTYIVADNILIWDNPDYSTWDSFVWADEGETGFTEPEEVFVDTNGSYIEDFTDEEFIDDSSTATIGVGVITF